MTLQEVLTRIGLMKKDIKVLFLCKRNYFYGHTYNQTASVKVAGKKEEKIFSGLYNSAGMVSHMLDREKGIASKILRVADGNAIDKEVHEYKPQVVIIEALWVTPTKLKELHKLHPNVHWVVRIHSEVPFLAMEGVAFEWLKEYTKIPKTFISCNSERAFSDLSFLERKHLVKLLNYYPTRPEVARKSHHHEIGTFNIGCFGAIRPMKNHLLQAIAAIRFARETDHNLKFHINATRVEQGGDPILKNLRNLFKDTPYQLIEHPWMEPHDFKEIIKGMDLGMQVSLSETFNIVSADVADCGVPIVVSKEIDWADPLCYADPNSVEDVVKGLYRVWAHKQKAVISTHHRLKQYSEESKKDWINFLHKVTGRI